MPDRPIAAVTATGLSLAYGRDLALAGASFTLPAGASTALIGPNGSGKSTLLHALAGLLRPRAGRLTVLGVAPDEARRRVSYVLQATKVNDHMPITVREVVTMGCYGELGLAGRLRRTDRDRVDDALGRLGLAELERRHLGELSGGQRQRVFVAQGLVQEADVLLLDEPVTGLDVVSRQQILDVVGAECRAGRTVVMSTHDLGEAAAADHLLLLANRVVASGHPDAVLTAEHLSAAYGGRLIRLAGNLVVLDDAHHHDHDQGGHDHAHRGHPHDERIGATG